eukprot:jgi/Psemu1/5612/gm1.5612_g
MKKLPAKFWLLEEGVMEMNELLDEALKNDGNFRFGKDLVMSAATDNTESFDLLIQWLELRSTGSSIDKKFEIRVVPYSMQWNRSYLSYIFKDSARGTLIMLGMSEQAFGDSFETHQEDSLLGKPLAQQRRP